MIRPGTEPRSTGPSANTLPTRPIVTIKKGAFVSLSTTLDQLYINTELDHQPTIIKHFYKSLANRLATKSRNPKWNI